jgi:putative ABC transport system permease protein
MNTTWRFAWRNIWRHPRRTILTMLAIAFGSALLVFSIGFQLGQYDLMIKGSVSIYQGLIQVQKEGYLDDPKIRTSIADIQQLSENLRQQTNIDSFTARANGFALVSSQKRTYGSIVTGVEPSYESKVSILPNVVREGSYLSSDSANEIVIGKSLAKNMQVKVGDELTIMGNGRDGSMAATVLPIVGIFESGSKAIDRNLMQIPLKTFQEIFSMGSHGHSIVFYHDQVKQDQLFKSQIENIITDKQLVTLTWDEIQPGIKQMIELDYSSGWFMYIVLIAVITFSILNTFLMSVLERTREFGIMLALGYKPFNIGKLVMLEAFILTLFALIAGTLLGLAINTYFAVYGLTFEGMDEIASMYNMPATIYPQISFESTLIGPLVIFIFTLLSALYPAMKIRKLQPVEAMRKI